MIIIIYQKSFDIFWNTKFESYSDKKILEGEFNIKFLPREFPLQRERIIWYDLSVENDPVFTQQHCIHRSGHQRCSLEKGVLKSEGVSF